MSFRMSQCEPEGNMAKVIELNDKSPISERSRRLRKMSKKFLHIFENSEVDDDVKKMTHFVSPHSSLSNGERSPENVVLDSNNDNKVVKLEQVDVPTDSQPISHNGVFVEDQALNTVSPKGTATYSMESVFKGRRGRPPKPLIVKIPRKRVQLHIDSKRKTSRNGPNNFVSVQITESTTRHVNHGGGGTPCKQMPIHEAGPEIGGKHLLVSQDPPSTMELLQQTANQNTCSEKVPADTSKLDLATVHAILLQSPLQPSVREQPSSKSYASYDMNTSGNDTSCNRIVSECPRIDPDCHVQSGNVSEQKVTTASTFSDLSTTSPNAPLHQPIHVHSQCLESLRVSYPKDVLGQLWKQITKQIGGNQTCVAGPCRAISDEIQMLQTLPVSVPLPKVSLPLDTMPESVEVPNETCTSSKTSVYDEVDCSSLNTQHLQASTPISAACASVQCESIVQSSHFDLCSSQRQTLLNDIKKSLEYMTAKGNSLSVATRESVALPIPLSKDHTYCQSNDDSNGVHSDHHSYPMETMSSNAENPPQSNNSHPEEVSDESFAGKELEAHETLDLSGDTSEEQISNTLCVDDGFSNKDEVQSTSLSPRPSREVAMQKRHAKAFLYDESIIDLLFEEEDSSSMDTSKIEDQLPVCSPQGNENASAKKKSTNKVTAVTGSSEGALPTRNLRQRKEPFSWSPKQKNTMLNTKGSSRDKTVNPPIKRARLLKSTSKPTSLKLTFRKLPASDRRAGRCARYMLKDSSAGFKHGDKSSTKPRAKNERLVLAPPPPRGRNYWKQAQAWLPRNIPGSKSAAYSLRKAANQLKPWKVDRKWLDENNGWKWLGDPITSEKYKERGKNITRQYFIGMRRGLRQAEDIYVRDCVLVFTGDSEQFPYIGRILSLWQDCNSDEMMFTCAWYHRPQDVLSPVTASYYGEKELFASSHRDDNPVASILGKCYVMGYNEFCRFKALLAVHHAKVGVHASSKIVPNLCNADFIRYHIPVVKGLEDSTHVYYCKTSLISARYTSNRLKSPSQGAGKGKVSNTKMMLLSSLTRSQQSESDKIMHE